MKNRRTVKYIYIKSKYRTCYHFHKCIGSDDWLQQVTDQASLYYLIENNVLLEQEHAANKSTLILGKYKKYCLISITDCRWIFHIQIHAQKEKDICIYMYKYTE